MRSIIACAIVLLVVSCGGYNEGVVLKAEHAYLVFKGDTTAVTVSVDGGTAFALDAETQRYQIKPGKHEVKIYRNGNLVLAKTVILDNQITMEIEIP